MQPRIAHQPTDRNKARWKAYALFALIGFWLCSGIVGRDPWKPDEPVYIGILQSLLDAVGSPGGAGGSAWRAMVAGQPVDGEITLIHWINAPLAALLRAVMPLHEAARVTSVLWAALGIASLFAAARRWSGGHISFLAAIIAIGCVGLYDRAHTYVPDIAVFAASALALYGCAALAEAPRRATLAFVGAIVLAFAARSVLGYAVVATPMLLLAWAPVYSMHRVALVRALLFGTFLCAFWLLAFWLRDSAGFADWTMADFGLKLEDRDRFGPTFYAGTLLWYAWPAWPVAVWLVTLRVRGFGGGWQRGEVIAPLVFLFCAFTAIALLTDPRALFTLYLLPPIVLLAAFGVDTLKRTWYALIDWFGILVLGLTSLAIVLIASALYFGWPPMIAERAAEYVPAFTGHAPWLGYGVAMVAFLIWVALIQPAHQHARRAMINWAGCVTFLWVVAQALLIAPANHINSYRAVYSGVNRLWPTQGCVNSIELTTSQAAMLMYHYRRQSLPVESPEEAQCEFLLLQRYRNEPPALPQDAWTLRLRSNRPGDNHEAFELYQRTLLAPSPPRRPDAPTTDTQTSTGTAP